MALTEDEESSYIDSMCVPLPALFVTCRSRAALLFALHSVKMIIITVKATMLIIKAVAREVIEATYTVVVTVG